MPVITRRTIVERLNLERLRAHAIEAAEQCERTALPELAEPVKLDALLKSWPADRALYFADERGGDAFAPAPGPAAILIGPEGGFTDEERDGDLRRPPGPPDLARPPHPARRHGGAGGGLALDGGGRGLALRDALAGMTTR